MLVERTYALPWSLNYPDVAEELADWLIAVIHVLESEPDDKLFPLVTRLASIAIDYSYEAELDYPATTSLTAALHDAFDLLRNGTDRHEIRAAFVLALVRATKHLMGNSRSFKLRV